MVDSYLYSASVDDDFAEGEFDHIILLERAFEGEPVQFRTDEVEAIREIPAEKLMQFIADEFDKFAELQKL